MSKVVSYLIDFAFECPNRTLVNGFLKCGLNHEISCGEMDFPSGCPLKDGE